MAALTSSLLIAFAVLFIFLNLSFLLYLSEQKKILTTAKPLGIILVSVIIFIHNSNFGTLQLLVLASVLIWGIRKSLFQFYRLKSDKNANKKLFKKYIYKFLPKTITLLIKTTPALVIFTSPQQSLSLVGFVGFLVWYFGFTIGTLGDIKKKAKKSRLGEMLVWLGVFTMSINSINYWPIGLISPLLVFLKTEE